MRYHKLYAMVYRDFLIYRTLKWKLFQFFYFPITTILIWGFFSSFIRDVAFEASLVVLIVIILWNFGSLYQSNTNTQILSDSWAGSLKHILTTGITEYEYMASRVVSSALISVFVIIIMLGMSFYMFDFSVLSGRLDVVSILVLSTLFSSIGLSVLIATAIMLLGREYDFVSWTAMQLFVLLSAPFFPVMLLPQPLQSIAYLMPFTLIFESARVLVSAGTVSPAALAGGLLTSVAYMVLSFPIYKSVFQRARKSGRINSFY